MQRRLRKERNEDSRSQKFLEDEAKEFVPAAIEVELTNNQSGAVLALSLIAEYKLKIPGWVAGAGRRALLPVGIFSATEKNVFDHNLNESIRFISSFLPRTRRCDYKTRAAGLAGEQSSDNPGQGLESCALCFEGRKRQEYSAFKPAIER